MNKHLETALWYSLKCGFSVIPCNREKKPLLKKDDKSGTGGWKEFQSRIAGEEEIRQWWQRWPNANVAIVTGRLSNLCVIDLDEPELATPVLDELIPDSIEYPIVNTPGGGQHWYFRFPTTMPLGNNAGTIPGADFRGEGGYVLAPPGIVNGKRYSWQVRLDETALNSLPQAYIDYVLSHSMSAKAGNKMASNCIYNNQYNQLYNQSYNAHARDHIYAFSENPEIMPVDVAPNTLDDETLQQKSNRSLTNSNNIQQSLTNYIPFETGHRDNDLFHIANQLFKARTDTAFIDATLLRLAQTCNFSRKEALEKVQSAKQRAKGKDVNLTREVKEWVSESNGSFAVSDIARDLGIRDTGTLRVLNTLVARLKKEGVIEKTGTKNGVYRLIDKECETIDITTCDVRPLPLELPLNVHELVHIHERNIVCVAGSSNSGKTAWLLNFAYMNRDKGNVMYFSSEMGAIELKSRLLKFEELMHYPLAQWKKVNFKERSGNFADVIDPDGINIIDFLEITDDFYKIAAFMKQIYDRLSRGIAVIAIQKNRGADLGRGGNLGLEKPRLYMTLDDSRAKIEKGKNWADSRINPNGMVCEYGLFQGASFFVKKSWYKPQQNSK